ncbi:MAG: transporter substrate-binding domain-containing protein [Clostridia bacterium]|nr:transporter substrate-binding domain-containing protein [Clostridia bacterium]
MKKILAVLLCLVMVFSFAACGKDDTVVVGYTIYEPMNYLDENGDLIGFDTELAEKVFENLGMEVVFKEIQWENKYTDLASGTIDCIWNGFTANSKDDDGIERSEKVDFSYNYMMNKQVVVVHKDADSINGSEDLNGKIGAAESGSAGETYAKDFKGIVFKGVTKQTDALLEVLSKTAAFAVVDEQLAKKYCGQGDYDKLQYVPEFSSDAEYYAIGFEKGSELTEKVNAEIVKLAEDGTIAKLAKKYGVENTAIVDYADQVK